MQAELLVLGDERFDPRLFQSAVGLKADKIELIGDNVGASLIRRKRNGWIISTGYSRCIYLEECARPLIARLEPFWERLRELTGQAGIYVEFSVAAYVGAQEPALHLDRRTVQRLAYIGAAIDIDIILLGRGDSGPDVATV